MMSITPEQLERLIRSKESITNSHRKYAEKNKDKVKEWARNFYNKMKEDPEFRAKQCERAKRYRNNKKQRKNLENETAADKIELESSDNTLGVSQELSEGLP